jgi:tetratricopeptide (TPR) repeat protein
LIESAAASLLGDLLLVQGRLQHAIKVYDEARVVADEASAVQMQMSTRRDLAWAHLLAGDVARARTFCDDTAKYNYRPMYASTLALGGVIALRQKDDATARNAFDRALSEAETRLAGTARAVTAAYAKALALAGLAICRDAVLAATAAQAYRDARALSAGPATILFELQKLDALAVADSTGTLKLVRAALAGEA